METVNFQCGHCGKLMGVGVAFLGQQVRCPHCQQVVLAPAAAGPPPAAPPPNPQDDPFRTLSINANEDIFTTRNEPEDALFGQGDAPRLEIPRDIVPSAPAQALDLPLESNIPALPPGNEALLPTVSLFPPDGQVTVAPASASPHEPDTMAWSPYVASTDMPASILEAPAPDMHEAVVPMLRKPRAESGRINWFIPLVFIPLVLYAVLATAAVGFLYVRIQSRPPSLWEQIPDEGDTPGVRGAGKKGASLRFDRNQATQALPEKLHVKLNQTLRIGDLEVTPTRVERQRVKVFVEGFEQPEACQYDSLVLTLKLRNLSEDYAFTPLDNYFDRHWNGRDPSVPLTVLVLVDGQARFFGGPAMWYPLNRDKRKRDYRQWVDLPGRTNQDLVGLAPGETVETCVCTDGNDPSVTAHIFGKNSRNAYTGNLLWRVQLRRGLVSVKGKDRSATAVIGVEFTSKDLAN